MKQYLELLKDVLENGTVKGDRTGTGTISLFGAQMRFDLQKGFPLVTTKKTFLRAIKSELLWFLEGSTDERRLAEIHFGLPASELVGKNTIWTANADAQGKTLGYTNTDTVKKLGPVYGGQWRNWGDGKSVGIDQVKALVDDIKNNPDSRRLILSAWNVGEIDNMALPPCHTFSQFYVNDGKLSCQMYQRSADMFLGIPFNIASYAMFTMMLAQVCGLKLGDFVHTIGDAHIYTNHVEQVKLQLSREPLELPTLKLNESIKDIDGFSMEDFDLVNYKSHESIKAPMAV